MQFKRFRYNWISQSTYPQGLYENSNTIIQFGQYNASYDMSFNIPSYIVSKISL